MNLLPLPADHVYALNKSKGLQYTRESNFKHGIPQRAIINACCWIFVWTGQVDKAGYYLYKRFNEIKSLTFC